MSPSLLLFFETTQVSNHKACMEQRIPFLYSANPYIKILNVSLGKSLTSLHKMHTMHKGSQISQERLPKRFSAKNTLKMTSAQDVETSVTTNSPSQNSFHPDDQIPSKFLVSYYCNGAPLTW